MKTWFILLISVVSIQACAQFSVGAKTGLSLPGMRGNSETNKSNNWREAIYGGVYLHIQFNRLFCLQPELNYSPQGNEHNGMQQVPLAYINGIKLPPATTVYARFNSSTILNYLEVPVLAKIMVGREITYSVYAGPYVSFLLSAKTKVRGNSRLYLDKDGEVPFVPDGEPIPSFSFDRNTNIKESIKKIGGGFQGGLGVGYPLWGGRLLFETRAIVGLTRIYVDPATNDKSRTGAWVMAVGYEFDLK